MWNVHTPTHINSWTHVWITKKGLAQQILNMGRLLRLLDERAIHLALEPE